MFGFIIGTGILAGGFSWVLQKPDGLYIVVMVLSAICVVEATQIGILQREMKKLIEQSKKSADKTE